MTASAGGTEPPPQVVSNNTAGNRNNRTERSKVFSSRKRLAAIFSVGGGNIFSLHDTNIHNKWVTAKKNQKKVKNNHNPKLKQPLVYIVHRWLFFALRI